MTLIRTKTLVISHCCRLKNPQDQTWFVFMVVANQILWSLVWVTHLKQIYALRCVLFAGNAKNATNHSYVSMNVATRYKFKLLLSARNAVTGLWGRHFTMTRSALWNIKHPFQSCCNSQTIAKRLVVNWGLCVSICHYCSFHYDLTRK